MLALTLDVFANFCITLATWNRHRQTYRYEVSRYTDEYNRQIDIKIPHKIDRCKVEYNSERQTEKQTDRQTDRQTVKVQKHWFLDSQRYGFESDTFKVGTTHWSVDSQRYGFESD